MKARYENDSDLAHKMRHLAALAFVPADEMEHAFEVLYDSRIIPTEAQDVMDYFEDTWVERASRRGRRPPRFLINMWNCFEAAAESMPKTNNAVEGWHTGFEATVDAVHPNIFKLVEALQREQTLADTKYEEMVRGEPPAKKKKKTSITLRDCSV